MCKINNFIMESLQLTSLLFLLSLCAVFSFPSRPLNERSSNISWQAWLLVDDQNQNKQSDDSVPRRRITPKSVFIAPTFSPESLPPCAEGYSSDTMGRCIKIIKLDEIAHMEFLARQFNERFGDSDYEEEVIEEAVSNNGPFQLNIPLSGDSDYGNEDSEQESDMAIIITPTNSNLDAGGFKFDKRDDEDKIEQELKRLERTTTTTKHYETTTTDIVESTALNDFSTVTEPSTTVDNTDYEIVTEIKTTDRTTTSSPEETSTRLSKSTTTTPKVITYHPRFERLIESSTKGKFVRFPEKPTMATLMDFIRFPDDSQSTESPRSIQNPHIRDVNSQFEPIFTPRPDDEMQNDHQAPNFFDDNPNGVHPQNNHPGTSRRNRDKHSSMFLFPTGSSDLQKPLILRFSRKHAYVDTNQLKNPQFYRSVPIDDLSFIFGYKHRQSSHR